jgi:hypothetical protein
MNTRTAPRRVSGVTGVTLVELATALALLAVGLSVALPPAAGLRDRLAVGAARNEVMALLLRARAEAPLRGGARIEFELGADEVRLVSGDSLLVLLHPLRDLGVEVSLGGGRESAEVAYDPLGLGRVASRTVIFARGRARDTLRISSYGRVTR